ncbi:MAG: GxxExxY protein [Candidatus Korobacteraceae bacterium]
MLLLKHSEITEPIIGAFYEVYNELGHGFLESVYREAMVIALQTKGLQVDREKAVTVQFRNQTVGAFRADLIVNTVVIVELKCARVLDMRHEAQLLNYLKATGFEVGLLLNFGARPTFKRLVFETARSSFAPTERRQRGRFRLEEH